MLDKLRLDPNARHRQQLSRTDRQSKTLGEESFLNSLCLERKRAERSARTFVLMLLERRPQPSAGEEPLARALPVIWRSVRETDIKGWYREGSALGVIFTEIGDAEGQSVAHVLRTRVTTVLSSSLTTQHLEQISLSFYVFPDNRGEVGPGSPTNSVFYQDLVEGSEAKKVARILKRSIDIMGSLMALILLSPVFAALSIGIKLSSEGPILFRQRRIGLAGRTFTFLKLRSMYVSNDHTIHQEYVKRFIVGKNDAAASDGQNTVYKLMTDPRITPFGRLLRRTSLDELPQFLNVLLGDMSLVGPRPPVQYEFDHYATWHKQRLLTVKPGITGLWQVEGRSKVKFDDMVRLDLRYARSWSLWLDIKILLRTPRAVFSREGAY